VATYWLALRRLGLRDALPGFGILAEQHWRSEWSVHNRSPKGFP
jgi:hypothetical protein